MFRLLLTLVLGCSVASALLPDQVVVVYNADSLRSEQCARAYCNKRAVPYANCLGLTGLKGETISRQVFNEKIRFALLVQAEQRDWNLPTAPGKGLKPVRAMVLMPDLPLRIKEDAEPGKKPTNQTQNCASVDSELMLLGANYMLMGPLMNPYFNKSGKLEHTKPQVLAVTRIDGPDDASIRRMIQYPAEVERRGGLWGWAVVDQGGPYKEGDKWFTDIARKAREHGMPLFHEESQKLLPPAFPLMQDTAVYFGWYTQHPQGPFSTKHHAGFSFAPGAVAMHLHSFSGTSVKSPNTWVGAFLQRGAVVTSGNVFEPLLAGTLRLDIFYDRLLKGYTVAEAGLMATPWLSWQGTILGDPLYRPFEAMSRNAGPADNVFVQWRQMMAATGGNRAGMTQVVQQRMGHAAFPQLQEMLAWHYAELKDYPAAIEAFGQVGRRAQDERNRVRAELLQANLAFVNKDERYGRLLMQRLLEKTTMSPFRPAVQQTAELHMPELRPAPKPQQPKK
ncbi:MAG: TIGR03790 family protein [Akkermansia sp.]|nr:TIGR03790 family protein [Akkermansia sp.]